MILDCHTLTLYCDARSFDDNDRDTNPNHKSVEFPHEFVGDTKAQTYRAARRAGWLLGKEQQLCPKCSGKRIGDT